MAQPIWVCSQVSNKLDGPKVTSSVFRNTFALVKLGHMLESLSIRRYSLVSAQSWTEQRQAVTIRSVQVISRKDLDRFATI